MFVSRVLDFQKTRYARFMNHRVPSNRRYQPTEYEHAANCATHAFWILPSILGSSILYILSDDQWETISAWIYGFGLSSLFIVSTIFHTISWKKRHLRTMEHCLHMFDRMVIYFFIAASYAPWLNLRELGPWASHMRWIIWIMASIGTVYVFFFHERTAVDITSVKLTRRSLCTYLQAASLSVAGTSWWSWCATLSWASSLPWSSSPCPTGMASRSWWPVDSPTAWAWSSSKATVASPSPMPSGTSSWPSELASTTMPFGGTSTGLARWRLKRPGRHLKDIVCTNWHVEAWRGAGRQPAPWARPKSPARPMGSSCRCPSCRDRRAWRLILNRCFFFNLRNCLFF
ncbi:monocyte to macrophage differentiation factor 2 isoform X1 [Aquila chrysaetos chrysaetos]|uniref:monocyte to macrophage differentiation factor 2 isoform X1 n=1 Tax=Aquila chrysaetos chrysaetos TaxID=223781 RepID=UPI0011770E18|nr:monocyte to macrophage differentiation factor 2 isoform X1 [Aquila chrysaetos chrysaetos]